MTYAKIVADSVSPDGVRLTTFEVRFHRFVLAEFNTHRVFSRNSASSRAIPVRKQIERLQEDLAYPVSWPTEQKGMQGGPEVSATRRLDVRDSWTRAAGMAIRTVRGLIEGDQPIHKSVVNRLLEPFMWHTVIVTATAYENFFALRLDSDAQPEIRVAAVAMKAAYDQSKPQQLEMGLWHLPYVDLRRDLDAMVEQGLVESAKGEQVKTLLCRISAARCARVSYLTQNGVRDLAEDLRLYDRLITDRVGTGRGIHWSPLEHVATPWPRNRQDEPLFYPTYGPDPDRPGWELQTDHRVETDHLPRVGNLLAWRSLRTEVEAIHGERTFR